MEIGTRYEPRSIENKWYEFWEKEGFFTPKGQGDKFSIVIPPPNITGRIHMGHALNMTLQDIVVRYKRMKGYDTLWLPGEDHAGIATQNAVEKYLAETEGKKKEDFTREEFLEIVWKWAKRYRKEIADQIRALGASVDWTRERFTLDEGLNKAVRKVFVQLYKEGLIYKGKYIVNWCPRCGTVLSDEEVEHEEHQGKLYYILYPFEDGDGGIVVATTRPETMLGDTAVAVHPEDERYKDFVGKTLILPLVGRRIPVIADKYVDPSFGTGAVKITPAHDPNDFLIAQNHDLPMVNIFDDSARVNENGGKYEGLDRYEARKAVVKDLEEQGFLTKVEDYTHSIGHCYRCHEVIEPRVSDQWFVKMKPLAKKAIEAVEKGEIRFFPERWTRVYLNWMYEIRDWCISRQLWWGHRIPIWYCEECGEVIPSEEELEKCPKCGSDQVYQDPDVLDTWFSSALWPFSTMGWPEETDDLKRYYPTDLLITGFDIIFFWVARMIVMGLKFMGKKPFSHVYIHQLVRDKYGRKMSKSLGNGIDPLDVIEEYGADPMRFTLAMLAAQGRDIKLDPRFFETYRRFANKIWNATRFVLMNLDGFEEKDLEELDLSPGDEWILSRLQNVISTVTEALESYDFNIAAKAIYDFFWSEFCDWYIELAKQGLKNRRMETQNVLVHVLDRSFRLLHPFMPFLTEELWQKLPINKEKSLTIARWPDANSKFVFQESERFFNVVMGTVRGIRNVRADMDMPQSTKVRVAYTMKNDAIPRGYFEDYVKHLGNLEDLEEVERRPSRSAVAHVDDHVEVFVLLKELDFRKEAERLKGKISKLIKEKERYVKKLENPMFVSRASEDIVEETRKKLEDLSKAITRLQNLLEELEG
ncbi:MAG: valine--tRNA ligase [Thermotogae bacterium]|nr:valine--tRNA ligase [Thermotogota bacterium]